MKSERKFLRQCINCKTYKSKEELIRITADNITKEIKLNNDNKIQGRSVYLCKNIECINNAIKKKKIEHFLKTNISDKLKDNLYTVLKN